MLTTCEAMKRKAEEALIVQTDISFDLIVEDKNWFYNRCLHFLHQLDTIRDQHASSERDYEKGYRVIVRGMKDRFEGFDLVRRAMNASLESKCDVQYYDARELGGTREMDVQVLSPTLSGPKKLHVTVSLNPASRNGTVIVNIVLSGHIDDEG